VILLSKKKLDPMFNIYVALEIFLERRKSCEIVQKNALNRHPLHLSGQNIWFKKYQFMFMSVILTLSPCV